MNKKYTNCPKCGTRNFTEDEECRNCNTKLKTIDTVPKKTIYLIVILLLALLGYIYSILFNEDKQETKIDNTFIPNSPTTENYSIVEIEINTNRLFRIKVLIERKITENELISISKKAYLDIDATSSNGIIFFYLPKMNTKDMAWAKVDFPEITANILGQTLVDEEAIRSKLDQITDYVGVWNDENKQGGVMIRIRKDKKEGYVFEFIDPNNIKPSQFANPLKRIIRDGKIIYVDIESPVKEYFVIEDNGDLSAYDKEGLIKRYPKLK